MRRSVLAIRIYREDFDGAPDIAKVNSFAIAAVYEAGIANQSSCVWFKDIGGRNLGFRSLVLGREIDCL